MSDDVRDAYDAMAPLYASLFLSDLDGDTNALDWLARFAELAARRDGVVADLGCGPGHAVNHLSELGLAAIGYDLSPGQIAEARNAFPNLTFQVGDLTALDLRVHPGHVPLVSCPEAFEGTARVPNPRRSGAGDSGRRRQAPGSALPEFGLISDTWTWPIAAWASRLNWGPWTPKNRGPGTPERSVQQDVPEVGARVRAMPSAVILGGTGAAGSATARRLARHGWQVTVTGRNSARMPEDLKSLGVRFASCDRADLTGMQSLLGRSGHDLVVDCLCFTASDAAGLLDLADGAGSTIMISTKAVYVDDAGSNVNSQEAPRFSRPITESQPVMAPGLGDPMVGEGYGSHKVAAEQTLLESDLPVTIIRPSKIHGPGGTQPREWIFVKRCLDRRPAVVLADRGQSIDHTTAAANLAALVEVVAHNPGRRILNSADPDSPTALDIARTIANHLDHDFDEYLLGPDDDPRLGIHPWMTAQPIILDTSAATALGYTPVGDYADTVAEAIEWMHRQAVDTDDGAILPGLDNDWFAGMFDYDREDRYITEHQTNGGARVGDS